MDNLILSFNVVAPLCFVMALGYFLKYLKMFDENTVNVMNNVAFKAFLPCLLFYNIYIFTYLYIYIFMYLYILIFIVFIFFYLS